MRSNRWHHSLQSVQSLALLIPTTSSSTLRPIPPVFLTNPWILIHYRLTYHKQDMDSNAKRYVLKNFIHSTLLCVLCLLILFFSSLKNTDSFRHSIYLDFDVNCCLFGTNCRLMTLKSSITFYGNYKRRRCVGVSGASHASGHLSKEAIPWRQP